MDNTDVIAHRPIIIQFPKRSTVSLPIVRKGLLPGTFRRRVVRAGSTGTPGFHGKRPLCSDDLTMAGRTAPTTVRLGAESRSCEWLAGSRSFQVKKLSSA